MSDNVWGAKNVLNILTKTKVIKNVPEKKVEIDTKNVQRYGDFTEDYCLDQLHEKLECICLEFLEETLLSDNPLAMESLCRNTSLNEKIWKFIEPNLIFHMRDNDLDESTESSGEISETD